MSRRPIFSPEQRERLVERLLRNSQPHPCGCRLWTGKVSNAGYGQITLRLPDRKHPVPVLVHRLAYWVFRRRPPKGKQIAHSFKCISPLCIEGAHLRATSHASNERDKKRAKRWRLRVLRTIDPPTHTFGVRTNGHQPKSVATPTAHRHPRSAESIEDIPF